METIGWIAEPMRIQNFPKISIVTACYNHASFIAETIESIISQQYPNLEYIVIDDGSTDNSWDIIRRYTDQLTYCERLEGYRDSPVTALNYGLEKTTGEIMLWLNSDDILLPKSLFVIAKIFTEHPEIEWFTGMATTINERGEIVNSKLRPKHIYDFLIGNWKVIQQESTSWRRGLWQKAGARLEGEKKWAFDTELWTRFFTQASHVHVDTPLGAFRAGKQSKSTSDIDSFMKPNLFYLEEFKKNAPLHQKITAEVYRCLRFLRCFLTVIPHSWFQHIPLLSYFGYNVLEYSLQQDVWKASLKNPFRN